MNRIALLTLLTLALSAVSVASIRSKRIVYESAGAKMEGFMAWDDSISGQRPGVLIVHDWNGLDAYEERRARMLAKLGYVAFACDIYGKDSRPKTQADNGRLAGLYKGDRQLYRRRLSDGLAILTNDRDVDKRHVAAIGYCFGGTGVLELARTGAKIAGVVSFHGGIDTPKPADDANIRCKVLICHGADDPYVPAKDQDAFKQSMQVHKKGFTWINYPGAVHAFTVPEAGNDNSTGAAYNEAADKKSWADMRQFFKKVLGK